MTNILALCLVLGTFLAAQVWTPTTVMTHRTEEPEANVIVKDGHRVVVVEYDREGKTNTKIVISPPETKHGEDEGTEKGVFSDVKGRVREAASNLPNIGQGISRPETRREEEGRGEESEAPEYHSTPGELICDAFGKCRHKIASTLGKAKDRISRVTEEAQHLGETAGEKAREAASETAGNVGEKVAQVAHEAKDKAKEKAHDTKEKVTEKAQDAAHKLKENIGHKAEEAKDKAKEKLTEKREHTKNVVGQMAREVKETAWGRVKNVTAEVLSPAKVGSVMGLMGFATAYGTCVWVTFVSSYILAGVLGRQQFGLVQSKVYPLYFKAMSLGILVSLLGHVVSRRGRLLTDAADMWQGLNLLCSLLMVEGNASLLEPKATKVMFERMKAEKEEGRGRDASGVEATEEPQATREEEAARQRLRKLSERLQRLNTYSSWLNIVALMALTWHLVYLGLRLNATC